MGNSVSEGIMGDDLKLFLETNMPKGKAVLGVSDSKLSSSISDACGIKCSHIGVVPEVIRGSTAAPTTTTAAPTTATAAPTEPVPCVNCTTEDNTPCQFPFIIGSKTYDRCTVDYDSAPWCSTKVDGDGNHISGYWGYCTDSCPGDEGFPSTGSGPAC